MIDPRELRISNLVQVDGRPFEVIGLARHYVYLQTQTPIEEVDPVPITQEWLERFGFQKTENLHFDPVWQFKLYDFEIWCDGSEFLHDYCISGSEIKSIHALQNLFYCLTGQELTVKQTA